MDSAQPLLIEDVRSSSPVSTFGLGLLFGAAVGAAIGLLFAPKEGSRLRRDVAGSMGRFKRQASAKMSDVAVKGRRAWDAGRRAYNETQSHVSHMPSAVSER
jgi:gas vesicle protein